MKLGRPAVFLDRDGTINMRAPEHEYIHDARDFQWLPGALEGMLLLAAAQRPLVVVSNQRGVSRGLVTEATLHEIEARIQEALGAHGCRVEAFRYCVHGLDEHCECRKPRPGLLCAAARDLQLDLPRSWMIGDSDTDVAAGRAAGCRTVRLTTTPGPPEPTNPDHPQPTQHARSLLQAAAIVLADGDSG